MMHRLRRYDVFRFAQNDVAPFGRNDAMFASMCRQAHIIREANIIRRSRHHLPKANIIQKRTFVGRQKCVFCWGVLTKKMLLIKHHLFHKNSYDMRKKVFLKILI